jgi:hypothetical protein
VWRPRGRQRIQWKFGLGRCGGERRWRWLRRLERLDIERRRRRLEPGMSDKSARKWHSLCRIARVRIPVLRRRRSGSAVRGRRLANRAARKLQPATGDLPELAAWRPDAVLGRSGRHELRLPEHPTVLSAGERDVPRWPVAGALRRLQSSSAVAVSGEPARERDGVRYRSLSDAACRMHLRRLRNGWLSARFALRRHALEHCRRRVPRSALRGPRLLRVLRTAGVPVPERLLHLPVRLPLRR